MGSLSINLAEKRLLQHLRLGGEPDDETGAVLIRRFAEKVAADKTTAPVLSRFGVSAGDVERIYRDVLKALMPRPWMNVSGPMLVPTGWFMEPDRLGVLLSSVASDSQDDHTQWVSSVIEVAISIAEETRRAHDEAYGPPSIERSEGDGLPSAGGCASVMILFLSTSVLLGTALVL